MIAVRMVLIAAEIGVAERIPHLVVAGACAWWAAAGLARGSGTRRGWALLGTMPFLAVAGQIAIANEAALGPLPLTPLIVILANTAWMISLVLLVRGVTTTGLVFPRTSTWTLATAAAVAVALALSYFPVASVIDAGVPADLAEWIWTVRRLYGALADVIVVALALEILRCVAPMGAGAVSRPYFFIAATALSFLCVTIAMVFTNAATPLELPLLAKSLETAAWGLLAVAGISQGRIARP